MIAVFSFGFASVAYAKTGYPDDAKKAFDIVASYYDVSSSNFWCFVNGSKYGPILIYYGKTLSSMPITSKDDGARVGFYPSGYGKYMDIFYFSSDNMYSKPAKISRYELNDIQFQSYGYTYDTFVSNILCSNTDIVSSSTGDVVFQKGTNMSPTPVNPETTPSASNTLLTMFSQNSVNLKTVLEELIAVLPLLIPVLISFLAIRKGIAFTLKTLKTS